MERKIETVTAPMTADAISAIGVIRVSGPETKNIVEKIFKGAPLEHSRASYGGIYDGDERVDEVVVTFFKAPRSYTQVRYPKDVFLVFGRESRGLPENLLERVYDRCIRIPMVSGARSLNLSNSVAIVAYEALRQRGFEQLLDHGGLTGREEAPGAWLDYLGGQG